MTVRLPRILAGLVFLVLGGPVLAAPPELSAYGNLPDVEDMAIAPGGERLAAIARINGQRELLLLDAQRNVLRRSSLGDLKVRSLEWVGNEKVMAITSATEVLGPEFTTHRHEFYGAMLVPVAAAPGELIFKNRPAIADAIFGTYGTRRIDGKWYGYFGGVELTDNGRTGFTFNNGRPALFGVELAGCRRVRRRKERGGRC